MRGYTIGFFMAMMMSACAARSQPQLASVSVPSVVRDAPEGLVRLVARIEAPAKQASAGPTPVLLVISNDGPVAIRIQYGNLHLVDDKGNTLAALPPVKPAEGGRHVSFDPDRQPVAPQFSHQGFAVAPLYHGVYTTVPHHGGYFPFDAYHYEQYHPRWGDAPPSETTLARALPEGVLDPEGSVQGLVYFEPVGKDVKELQLSARFEDARQEWGQRAVAAAVELPLRVVR